MKEKFLIILIIVLLLLTACSINNPVIEPASEPVQHDEGSSEPVTESPKDEDKQEKKLVSKLDNLTINFFEYKPDIRVDLSYPCVYGDKAAWQSDLKDDMDRRRIVLFDIDKLEETDICEYEYYLDDVCINEKYVSWVKTDEEYWELTLYDIQDKSARIVRSYNDILKEGCSSLFVPRIMMSNDYMVWIEGLGNRNNPDEKIYRVMTLGLDKMVLEEVYKSSGLKNLSDRIRISNKFASCIDIIDGIPYVCRCNLETKEILKLPVEGNVFRPYSNDKYIVYACGNHSVDNALYCYYVETGETEKVADNIRAEYCLVNDNYIVYNKKEQYYLYSTISKDTLKLTDEEKGSYLFGSVGGNKFIFANTKPYKTEIVIAEFINE